MTAWYEGIPSALIAVLKLLPTDICSQTTGEKIKVEQIAADVGQEIVIDQVLAVGNGAELKVGTPLVSGASVKAMVVAHGKHDKVRIFKMRRRKHYQKRQGHRQQFTELQIASIQG
jgi:large subunit ribosomal protein L21